MKTHVDAADARGAGKTDECFYCRRRLGEEHTWECVIPTRRVKLRATIEYEAEVPRSWDADFVHWQKNEKACLSNVVSDIKEFSDRVDEAHPNECQGHPPIEYLGEVPE